MSIFPYRITTRRPSGMKEMRLDIESIKASQENMTTEMLKISECMEKLCADNSPVFTGQKKTSNWKVHL